MMLTTANCTLWIGSTALPLKRKTGIPAALRDFEGRMTQMVNSLVWPCDAMSPNSAQKRTPMEVALGTLALQDSIRINPLGARDLSPLHGRVLCDPAKDPRL